MFSIFPLSSVRVDGFFLCCKALYFGKFVCNRFSASKYFKFNTKVVTLDINNNFEGCLLQKTWQKTRNNQPTLSFKIYIFLRIIRLIKVKKYIRSKLSSLFISFRNLQLNLKKLLHCSLLDLLIINLSVNGVLIQKANTECALNFQRKVRVAYFSWKK
jgi:hypothetical protein